MIKPPLPCLCTPRVSCAVSVLGGFGFCGPSKGLGAGHLLLASLLRATTTKRPPQIQLRALNSMICTVCARLLVAFISVEPTVPETRQAAFRGVHAPRCRRRHHIGAEDHQSVRESERDRVGRSDVGDVTPVASLEINISTQQLHQAVRCSLLQVRRRLRPSTNNAELKGECYCIRSTRQMPLQASPSLRFETTDSRRSRLYSETERLYWEPGGVYLETGIRKLDGCIRKLVFGNYEEQHQHYSEIINFSRNYPPMFIAPPPPRHPHKFYKYEEHSV